MTQTELNQLYKSIATDFKIVARKTELWNLDYCYDVLHDVKKFMLFNYADTVSIVLHDTLGNSLKAKKYQIGATTRSQNDRPGTVDWEDGEGSGLLVVITHTNYYMELPTYHKDSFFQELRLTTWGPSGIDVHFPHLPQQISKRYTHGSSGIDRTDFN